MGRLGGGEPRYAPPSLHNTNPTASPTPTVPVHRPPAARNSQPLVSGHRPPSTLPLFTAHRPLSPPNHQSPFPNHLTAPFHCSGRGGIATVLRRLAAIDRRLHNRSAPGVTGMKPNVPYHTRQPVCHSTLRKGQRYYRRPAPRGPASTGEFSSRTGRTRPHESPYQPRCVFIWCRPVRNIICMISFVRHFAYRLKGISG